MAVIPAVLELWFEAVCIIYVWYGLYVIWHGLVCVLMVLVCTVQPVCCIVWSVLRKVHVNCFGPI